MDKFHFRGTTYMVPYKCKHAWATWMSDPEAGCEANNTVGCKGVDCSRCIYSESNTTARAVFYYSEFPEEKKEAPEKSNGPEKYVYAVTRIGDEGTSYKFFKKEEDALKVLKEIAETYDDDTVHWFSYKEFMALRTWWEVRQILLN